MQTCDSTTQGIDRYGRQVARIRALMMHPIAVPLLVGLFVPLTSYVVACWYYGSEEAVSAAIRGEVVFAEREQISLHNIVRGSSHQIKFVLRNTSSRAVKIIDSRLTCRCLTLGENSGVIPAGGRLVLPMTVSTSVDDRSSYFAFVRLYFDTHDKILTLRVEVDFASEAAG